jgi:hypothetical protein
MLEVYEYVRGSKMNRSKVGKMTPWDCGESTRRAKQITGNIQRPGASG